MSQPNKVLQFEGDIRLWTKATNGDLTPVIPDVADADGNQPVEANASIFSYAAGDERTVKSKRRGKFNQTIYSDQDPGESSISLALLETPGPILARVFYGEAADVSVTGAAVTNEVVPIVALGQPLSLAHRYLAASPAPVVKDNAAAVTYVAGTDYTIDCRRGTLVALAGGAIEDGDPALKVSYTHETYSLVSIRGGVQPTETFYITGDMLNRPDKQDLSLEIYEAKLSTDGDVDLFSADPITVTLKGPLITPSGKLEPYVVKSYNKAA
ncbi:hypothetical protein [Arenimonas oryziterrae]|uniref:Major tail protein n=1 Tax=Arenimonas oryziterrae DSM 21050 = YC6267 TaxID=1121015 RepID=A0A091BD58_9GAMM|nr:hypothetical protein [Arenimonas oryziterrae]KFN42340.1 hypothetical protein N789_14215 [Arenimonas oryziterrae DSM 21050 = YC6267]